MKIAAALSNDWMKHILPSSACIINDYRLLLFTRLDSRPPKTSLHRLLSLPAAYQV